MTVFPSSLAVRGGGCGVGGMNDAGHVLLLPNEMVRAASVAAPSSSSPAAALVIDNNIMPSPLTAVSLNRPTPTRSPPPTATTTTNDDSSSSSSSSTCRRRRRRFLSRTSTASSSHHRPTWMHLSSASSTTNHEAAMANTASIAAATANESESLAPIFSSPREASAAYQRGLLKSLDPSTITSKYGDCHSSIRLAFRYVTTTPTPSCIKKRAKNDNTEDDDDDEEDLFLCWIDEHGNPFHFRRLRPRSAHPAISTTATAFDSRVDDKNNAPSNATMFTNNTIPTPISSSSDAATISMVNELDHIEKTKPGHAFVLCRKVHPTRSLRDGINGDIVSGGDDTSTVVSREDGMTYFVRSNHRKTKNSRGFSSDGCYLVVGGFRPGPVPNPIRREEECDERDIHGPEEEEDDDGDNEEDDDEDDEEDDNIYVQLVTITRMSGRMDAINKSKHRSAATTTDVDTEYDDDDADEDGPTATSWKTLWCACFPGMGNAKSHRAPAFVAVSQVDLAASTLSQLLPGLPKDGHQITTIKNAMDDGECIFDITVSLSRLDPTPIDTSSKHYDAVLLGDWPCRIEPRCFPSNMTNPTTGQNTLQCRFESDILAASASLPPHARERLKKTTPIWINKSSCYGPKASPIVDRDACFHPGREWLIKNGMNPAKCGGVEWYDAQHYLEDCDLWGPGGQVLHELSHAWHCLHIDDGYDNEEIINVYNLAMKEGLYDCVRVHDLHGRTKVCRAYACNNAMEYFAELSVAFLGGVENNDAEHNKWYPFNRRQVREHDPRAFDMLCRMWGVVVDEGVN